MTGDEWRKDFELEIAQVCNSFGCDSMTGLADFVLAKLIREHIESLASAIDWQSDLNKTEDDS